MVIVVDLPARLSLLPQADLHELHRKLHEARPALAGKHGRERAEGNEAACAPSADYGSRVALRFASGRWRAEQHALPEALHGDLAIARVDLNADGRPTQILSDNQCRARARK